MNRKLNFLFHPNTIAVIGASDTQGKVGHSVMKNIISSGFPTKGDVFPINPKLDSVLGFKSYKSVLDVPKDIDLGVVCIPAKLVVDAVRECAIKKVKGLIIITAGFKEVGTEGAVLEKEISKIAEENNIRILGPNCLGLISPAVNASFASKSPLKGQIAMVSQSGAMMTAILDWSISKGIGFSNFVSLGNKADLDEVDFIEEFAEDPNTNIILLYIESVVNGQKFLEVVPKATKKKPVIIIKSGTSEAGSRAASSHTGALAGNDISFDLAFEKTGVIRAKTMTDLFDLAAIFNKAQLPKGKNFAIVTNAGGPGIVTTDGFETYGLGLTRFSKEIIDQLRAKLPAEAAVYDPVDIIGDAPPERYRLALETIFQEPNEICAGALVLVTPQAQTNPPKVAEVLLDIQKKFPEKLIVAAFMGGISMVEPIKILQNSSIPCYEFPEPAIKSMKYMTIYADLQKLPDISLKQTQSISIDRNRIEEIIKQVRLDGRNVLQSSETSEIFSIYGIKSPKTYLAKSSYQAEELAEKVGYPLVMKIVSPDIIHKSDIGGVMLGIKNKEEAKNAFLRIISNAEKFGPMGARILGVEIQEMILTDQYKKKNELIIGMSRDPQWGALLMVGTGGIYTNFLKDVSFELSYKYTIEDAQKQLKKTKIYTILKGVRGEPPSDLEAIYTVLVRLSQLVNDFPEIVELDINPLLVFEENINHDGYSAVDIKITIKSQKIEH